MQSRYSLVAVARTVLVSFLTLSFLLVSSIPAEVFAEESAGNKVLGDIVLTGVGYLGGKYVSAAIDTTQAVYDGSVYTTAQTKKFVSSVKMHKHKVAERFTNPPLL